jgi:hypothetical protein
LVVRLYRRGCGGMLHGWMSQAFEECCRLSWYGIVLLFRDACVQLKHEVRSGGVGCYVMWLFWGVVIVLTSIRLEVETSNNVVDSDNTREMNYDNVTQVQNQICMQGRKTVPRYA